MAAKDIPFSCIDWSMLPIFFNLFKSYANNGVVALDPVSQTSRKMDIQPKRKECLFAMRDGLVRAARRDSVTVR